MERATAEERALARASVYRLLALAFSYPFAGLRRQVAAAAEVAAVGSALLGAEVAAGVEALARAVDDAAAGALERSYQKVFTLSYSEDCPPYETAFSASHVFQQTQHQADISGFYKAFGVEARADRPDHLAVELEFGYLLAVKEAKARADGDGDGFTTTRAAHRSFMKDHLARWAPLVAGRIVLAGGDRFHSEAGRLLAAFVAWEERFLRIGRVGRYRDEPLPLPPSEPEGCPVGECGPLIEALHGEFPAVGP